MNQASLLKVPNLPSSPGVYFFCDSHGKAIYVGKAKNLKRRLAQYRNAKRIKKHLKMRRIVSEATALNFEPCDSVLLAEILESRLIRSLHPKFNVAGAFSFLYPMLGIKLDGPLTKLCYTTDPSQLSGWRVFGSYRSRFITGNAFTSLCELLEYFLSVKPERIRQSRWTKAVTIRGIKDGWADKLVKFFLGDSCEAVEDLVLSLTESRAARKNMKMVQRHLNNLDFFWKHEALRLNKVIRKLKISEYPIRQEDRDELFLRFRHLNQ